jgi:septal ring factor EnvC (AmiA/AmiB activator)
VLAVGVAGVLSVLCAQQTVDLGELDRLRAEARLREAEAERVNLEIEGVAAAIEDRTGSLTDLELSQAERKGYLAFRLREIYKQGSNQTLRRLFGGEAVDSYLSGLQYAAYLSERDVRVLADYRDDAKRLVEERESLTKRRSELEGLRAELARARRRLAVARDRRSRLLEEVREDKSHRERALEELQGASSELSRLVDSFRPGTGGPSLDVQKFRGLLDWPAEGEVSAGFGTVIHPRFKTRVPHPGLDIDGAQGESVHSVFDGRVVFASWMRGYGLTAIVDHGNGLLSVYAHASALLVEPGEQVLRGQLLGKIGETGSLRGPYLYFELRENGVAVDPVAWLRNR